MEEKVISSKYEHEKLVEDFKAFRNQCMDLRRYYCMYKNLFEPDERVKKIMHNTAKIFFGDLNKMLIEYIFLLVGRITDPAKFSNNENLSVEYIDGELKKAGFHTDEISQQSIKLVNYGKKLKSARNKKIAHNDKNTILSGSVLSEHKRSEMIDFFDHDLQDYCDEVGKALGVGASDFRFQTPYGEDEKDLINMLERGMNNPQQEP